MKRQAVVTRPHKKNRVTDDRLSVAHGGYAKFYKDKALNCAKAGNLEDASKIFDLALSQAEKAGVEDHRGNDAKAREYRRSGKE